jgi:hypothetical protein
MRTSMAYFAGAGTVVIAIAAGIGGGLTIANIVSPHASNQEMTKLEQRRQADRALDPVKDTNQPSQPMSYLAATQPAAGSTVAQPPVQNPPASQTEASNPAPQPAQPAAQSDMTAANNAAAKPGQSRSASLHIARRDGEGARCRFEAAGGEAEGRPPSAMGGQASVSRAARAGNA